jgi:hypothetical protein
MALRQAIDVELQDFEIAVQAIRVAYIETVGEAVAKQQDAEAGKHRDDRKVLTPHRQINSLPMLDHSSIFKCWLDFIH